MDYYTSPEIFFFFFVNDTQNALTPIGHAISEYDIRYDLLAMN